VITSESVARKAAVAGIFYPGTKNQLQAEVANLLHGAPAADDDGSLVALIVPHAGYAYSGATAAKAFALMNGRTIDVCILVGPSHQEYFQGVSVYPGSAYMTPLGRIDIDTDLRDAVLGGSSVVHASLEGHRSEHSLEVQIPFLQSVLPNVKILPLVMGDQHAELCLALGETLASAARNLNVVLVASSDLSHFHTASVARKKDREVIALIEQYNVRELMNRLDTASCEACGGGPIAAVMTAAHLLGAHRASIVHACNSGDVTGETHRVVGYCSAALWKKT
jgi:MEMO1 family protein